jgi:hypothetical protein
MMSLRVLLIGDEVGRRGVVFTVGYVGEPGGGSRRAIR